MSLENPNPDKYKEHFFYILALHGERLTRRNVLGLLNLLEGVLGFGSCILCALTGLLQFRLLHLTIALQGLKCLDHSLELLLRLGNLCLVLLARGAFRGRLSSASANAFLSAATSAVATNKVYDTLVRLDCSFFSKYTHRLLHTLAIIQLLLHEAELLLGPLQFPLQSGDLRSMSGGSLQRYLLIHIDNLC